jgi:hypothetical protein
MEDTTRKIFIGVTVLVAHHLGATPLLKQKIPSFAVSTTEGERVLKNMIRIVHQTSSSPRGERKSFYSQGRKLAF